MAEIPAKELSDTPKVTYLFRASDGRTTRVEMESRGYYTHVFIRNLAEKMELPVEAIRLHVQDPAGTFQLLDPTRSLDEQLMRLAQVSKEQVSETPIEVRINEDVIGALQAKGAIQSEQANISHIRSRRFRRPCVVVRDPVVRDPMKNDPLDIIRLARTVGATKRGGFLWLGRLYLIKFGEESERYYTYDGLHRRLRFVT